MPHIYLIRYLGKPATALTFFKISSRKIEDLISGGRAGNFFEKVSADDYSGRKAKRTQQIFIVATGDFCL